MRDRIEETLDAVGAEKPFGRNSPAVERADGDGTVPWTLPLDRLEAVALTGIIRTASIALLAAVSGMRSSELMELETGLLPSAGRVRPRPRPLPAGQQDRQGPAARRDI